MFASLKNKIREETGSDLSKFTTKLTATTVQKIESIRGRSHHGSTSSLNSIVSSDGLRDDVPVESDELRKRISKIETDFAKKLEQKEHEWHDILKEKDRRLNAVEKERDEAFKMISNLKEALKNAEDLKQRILEHQENTEQIENLQTQELGKIKHLVLLREQELAQKTSLLKEANAQLEKLRTEVSRLRRQEEHMSDLQDVTETEAREFKKNLENVETELDRTEEENSRLKISVDSEHMTSASLRQIIVKLEKELAEERANSLNVQKTLSRVTSEKNTALLRNAEVSQQMELVKQNMRRQEMEMSTLLTKLTGLEEENGKLNENRQIEEKLSNSIADLKEQLLEKNKMIKMLQLRLADLKKTLQQELRVPETTRSSHNNSPAVLTPSQILTKNFPSAVRKDDEDVNFRYLKHVVIKFLTSREYEAQHLIKAISTLLKFTPEEEKLIQDTLEWKKSWFGTKPKLQKVQKSVHFAS